LGLESPSGFVLQGLPSTASTVMGVWAFSFILIVTAPLACCAFIALNPSWKLYNNAIIIQMQDVPSDKLCAQFQAINGGTVDSALNKCLVQGTLIRHSQTARVASA
jgi:hypothetical protein